LLKLISAAHLALIASLSAGSLSADPIAVRQPEGRIHGFLVIRDTGGAIIATGELSQFSNGNRVTGQLNYRFKDGSVRDETTVYTQRKTFQLISYHLIQKGPAFQSSTDLTMDVPSGQVTVRYTDDKGKQKIESEKMKLPADLANGLVPTLLGDLDPKAVKTVLSMVVTTPKPRLVKLEITPAAEDTFTVGGSSHKALHYQVHVNIGGISGVIAPLVGKQPEDTHMWMVGGSAPGFLRSDGPMFDGGPIWRIELASPVWSK